MTTFKSSRSILWQLTLVLSALTLSACSGAKPLLMAERPKDQLFRTNLNKEMSTLNVAIEVSTAELAAVLNQTVATELYKGPTKIRGLSANISRNGPIAASAVDNYLYFTIPVAMSFSYGIFSTPASSLALKFKVNASITPAWKLDAKIYYVGMSDIFAENISIGPLSIKPRSIVEGATQPLQKLLTNLVNTKLNENFSLRNRVESIWKAFQKPILLDRNYNAWLKISPRDVMLYPPYAENNQLKLSLGLNSFAELVAGSRPEEPPPLPLPDLKLINRMEKNFRITLNTDLSYRDIVSIAAPLLLNRDFGSDGKSVILKDFDVYGNGDRLVVKVETMGSLDGVFYLTCKPSFNPQTNIFSVEEVDFDMNSESILLNTANWFLHGTIRDLIHEKLNMDLTQRVEKARDMAGKALARVKLAEHIFLKGSVNAIKLTDVVVQKDKISIQLYAEGETAIVFQ